MSDPAHHKETPLSRRIVVVGARGLLGSALMAHLAETQGFSVVGLDCDDCDIADPASIADAILAADPHVIFNCAAFTQVDACQSQAALAFRVNGEGAGNVAAAARAIRAKLIHISTDYVFDGCAQEPIAVDSQPGPPEALSIYGQSKLEGECRVSAVQADAVIVRTAWMYGQGGSGFPDAILRQARNAGHLRVVNDQTGSPTYANDVAAAIVRVALTDSRGIFHVTNAGQCTWFDFACEILRLAGMQHVKVEPVPTSAYPRPAKRPGYSVLDNARFDTEVGPPLRHWREALAEYMTQLAARGSV